VARPKRGHPQATDTLDEFESRGERIIEWVGSNPRVVLGTVAVLLVTFAAYGLTQRTEDRRETAGSAALAEARGDYLSAMGASPGALEAPELANPAAGEQIRQEYAERFAAVATEHPGTVAAAVARLEQGNLLAEGGDVAGALTIWREAAEALPASAPVAGLLHQRIGQALEGAEDWEGAGYAYEAAADVADYTFRDWALAEAARCYAQADRPEKALELYQRLQSQAPDLQLPDHLRTQLKELEAASRG